MSAATNLRIMPREMRMMAERILSLTGQPKGVFLMMPDHVMYSQALGLGGFAKLETLLGVLKVADRSVLAIEAEEGNSLTLSCGGQHAWVVALTAIDLLGELVAAHGSATVALAGVADPAELAIVVPLARRSALDVTLDGATDKPVLHARGFEPAGNVAVDEPLLWALLMQGLQIPAAEWWRAYHLAKKALAPDTVVSRRHAGPMIVNDDGSVIGRKDNDDETDISFLASAGSLDTREGDATP